MVVDVLNARGGAVPQKATADPANVEARRAVQNFIVMSDDVEGLQTIPDSAQWNESSIFGQQGFETL